MLRTVKKAFAYAHDGIHAVDLAEGDEAEIRDQLVEGLTASGHLAKPDGAPVADGAKAQKGNAPAPTEAEAAAAEAAAEAERAAAAEAAAAAAAAAAKAPAKGAAPKAAA